MITNSTELAAFLQQFNDKISVLPSFFDFSLIPELGEAYERNYEEVRIGFAGSPSRASDLDIVAPLIPKILSRYSNVVFEFIGAAPSGITSTERIHVFPYLRNYEEYIRFQVERRWSIGLAPLIDHEGNRAKTDNKYREYGAFGCAGIYSGIPPYTQVVTDSVTGYLVENTENAWLLALNELIENPATRSNIARAALLDVQNRYDLSRVAEQWASLFRRLSNIPASAALVGEPEMLPTKAKALSSRLWLQIDAIRQQGGWLLVVTRIIRKLWRVVSRTRPPSGEA